MQRANLLSGLAGLAMIVSWAAFMYGKETPSEVDQGHDPITIFMCGDVMLGRGIDQILPHPGDPTLHESYMKSAEGYVELAERIHGPIPRAAAYAYIWGEALEVMDQMQPDLSIINLETSITRSEDPWRNKGIHYRMHPDNIACLTAAKIDFCSLANNHVLDWGYAGLKETLESLQSVHVRYAGAGIHLEEAETPAIFEMDHRCRVIVFSCGMASSGIPPSWSATEKKPGVYWLRDLSDKTVHRIREQIQEVKKQGDMVILSIHWGGNWGYEISAEQTRFAHQLIDEAGVNIIHGHSCHHVKGIEVYKDRLILYACGDFMNDYEGISGYEQFRDDLSLMYFASLDPGTGNLHSLRMIPTQIKFFKVNKAKRRDVLWLNNMLNREGMPLGTSVVLNEDSSFTLQWD